MSVFKQMFSGLDISPVHLGEIIIILAILILAAYILYSLNLFKKER